MKRSRQTVFPLLASMGLLASFWAAPASADEKSASPSNGGIVFVGSSIFQYWTHLTEQMAPLPVLNRAIAGLTTQDMLGLLSRVVLPYKPRIVVFYCGSNDISVGETADAIIERTKRFLQILGEKSPDTFVYYTSILKAPEKMDRWDVVDAVNQEMARYSRQRKTLGYIDLNPVLFDSRGALRLDLFLPDGLHFRHGSTAYVEFSQVVKPILSKAWESGVGRSAANK
jgi:lysophospholipase L1-like esterase